VASGRKGLWTKHWMKFLFLYVVVSYWFSELHGFSPVTVPTKLLYQPEPYLRYDQSKQVDVRNRSGTSPRLPKTLLRSSSLLVSFCHTEKSLETRKKPSSNPISGMSGALMKRSSNSDSQLSASSGLKNRLIPALSKICNNSLSFVGLNNSAGIFPS